MNTKLLCVLTCCLLLISMGWSQAIEPQYFSALITTRDGADRKLLNLSVTPALGDGRLVIVELSNTWISSSVSVYQLGTDFSIELQGKTHFLLRFATPYGKAISTMITYTYDSCLRELTMAESTTTMGEATFTEWNIWKRKGIESSQEPVTFLFPLCGIYPYWDNN